MNRLAMNTTGDELEKSASSCRSEGIGIEVTGFYLPSNLDGDTTGLIDCFISVQAPEFTWEVSHDNDVADPPRSSINSVGGQEPRARTSTSSSSCEGD